jgi:hypothetical protein
MPSMDCVESDCRKVSSGKEEKDELGDTYCTTVTVQRWNSICKMVLVFVGDVYM